MLKDFTFITMSALLVVAIVVCANANLNSEPEYQKQCAAVGGKPAFNGQFWECLK